MIMRQILLLSMCGVLSSCWWFTKPPKTPDAAPSPPFKHKPLPPPEVPNAQPIPGRDGFVFSPYGNRVVDCRGLTSGTLVYDPYDTEEPRRKFRVP